MSIYITSYQNTFRLLSNYISISQIRLAMLSKTCQQWEAEWAQWLENAEHDSISEESTIANFKQEVDEDTDAQLASLKQEQFAYVNDWNSRMAEQYGAKNTQVIEDDIVYKDYGHRSDDAAAQGVKKKKALDEQLARWKETAQM